MRGTVSAALQGVLSPILLGIFVASMPTAARAGVATTSLADLVRMSERVVVGKVECLHHVERDRAVPVSSSAGPMLRRLPAIKIAEVSVSEVLRGEPHPKRVFVLASSTWRCDIAQAVEGEEAIFCLEPTGEIAGSPFEKSYAQLAQGAELHKIVLAGRGRLPIGGTAESAYASYFSPLKVPAEVMRLPADRTPEWEYEVLALSPLLDRIRAYVELDREPSWIELDSPARSEDDHRWSLAINGHGLGMLRTTADDDRLESGSGHWIERDGRERVFRLEPAQIAALAESLSKAKFESLPPLLGSQLGSPRRLTVRSESVARTTYLFPLDATWMGDPAHADEARRFLRVWESARGLFEDPLASDHRVADREWLDGPR